MIDDKQYNEQLSGFNDSYRELNNYVMKHTLLKCEFNPFLREAIESTKAKQYVVFHSDVLDVESDGRTTNIIVSKKRSFEAASNYKGKKVAVLNFANNHCAGGAPFSAGAQEESLCRISTLYPCLLKEKDTYYDYHRSLYEKGLLDNWGNDDLIYHPGVVVFKTDESAPRIMLENDWYKVDVITCAAPELYSSDCCKPNYANNITTRLKRVLQIAKKEGVEVLILGAWGCGAFHNPPESIARAFKTLCGEYRFDTIEFAIDCSRGSTKNYDIFIEIFKEK